jgi:hypothetical protein
MAQVFLNYLPLVHARARRARTIAATCFRVIGVVHFLSGVALGLIAAWSAEEGELPAAGQSEILMLMGNGGLPLLIGAAYLVAAHYIVHGRRGLALAALCLASLVLGLLSVAMVQNTMSLTRDDPGPAGFALGAQLTIDILLHLCMIAALADVLFPRRDEL